MPSASNGPGCENDDVLSFVHIYAFGLTVMIRIVPLAPATSPLGAQSRRESAAVEIDGRQPPQVVWIDVPQELPRPSHADHWLILGFMLAYERSVHLEVAGQVDELLVRNLRGVNHLLNTWLDRKHQVEIVGAECSKVSCSAQRRGGLFFSGGVDSMFSLFSAEMDHGIADLLTVWGFDIPLEKPDEFEKLSRVLETVAAKTNKVFTPVSTNLRSLGEPFQVHWGDRGHGAALAAVAHLCSAQLTEVRIASSFDFANLFPWGSHPFLDPLFSSSRLSIVHDGIAWSRVDKTRLITQHEAALASVHVCHKLDSAHNCSRCAKCLRTMITIDCLGSRQRASSFDWSAYELSALPPVLISNALDRAFFSDIERAAIAAQRHDIRQFIKRSLRYSRWMRPLPGRMLKTALARRYARMAERWSA